MASGQEVENSIVTVAASEPPTPSRRSGVEQNIGVLMTRDYTKEFIKNWFAGQFHDPTQFEILPSLNPTATRVRVLDLEDQVKLAHTMCLYLRAIRRDGQGNPYYSALSPEELEEFVEHEGKRKFVGRQTVTVLGRPLFGEWQAAGFQMDLVRDENGPLRAQIVEFIPCWEADIPVHS